MTKLNYAILTLYKLFYCYNNIWKFIRMILVDNNTHTHTLRTLFSDLSYMNGTSSRKVQYHCTHDKYLVGGVLCKYVHPLSWLCSNFCLIGLFCISSLS